MTHKGEVGGGLKLNHISMTNESDHYFFLTGNLDGASFVYNLSQDCTHLGYTQM